MCYFEISWASVKGAGVRKPPTPTFLTQLLGLPLPQSFERKSLYSQLYYANGTNRTIKGTFKGPKRH